MISVADGILPPAVVYDTGDLDGDEEDLEEHELLESLIPLEGLADDPHCGVAPSPPSPLSSSNPPSEPCT